jgi:hypothetical protein
MAEVILLREGRQPPGKMYSFMKSELLLYSSYLSSGMDINCAPKKYNITVSSTLFIAAMKLTNTQYIKHHSIQAVD